jgi:lipid-A-disaccharide synthase
VRALLSRTRPDLLVPIDYPDFNFRLLPFARKLGIPVAYYISPQVWAWRQGRVEALRRHVRRIVVIFPFEEGFYRDRGVPVRWVGHPLADEIAPAGEPREERERLGLDPEGPAVALLPGSRLSEIGRIAPALSGARSRVDAERAAAGLPPIRWILGRAPGLPARALAPLEGPGTTVVDGGLDALRAADLGLVASGTATLEAALLGRAVIVVYRMHPLTYALARRLVRVEHIAMANLIAGRRLVPELVQEAASPERIARELTRLLDAPEERARIRDGLLEARERLGPPGAARRAARAILETLEGG